MYKLSQVYKLICLSPRLRVLTGATGGYHITSLSACTRVASDKGRASGSAMLLSRFKKNEPLIRGAAATRRN
jgi:hypothetical protein